jgi:hypothetical protein
MTSTMNYRVLGMSMQRRSARRWLVVCTYAVLAALCVLNVVYAKTMGFWIGLYGSSLVSLFVFGGNGRYGLIKPFLNKPPRPEVAVVNLLRLQLSPPSAGTPEEASWRNDERELSRRDLAHYRAYQPLTVMLIGVLLLAAMAIHPTHWVATAVILQLLFAAALVTTVSAVTLPAAMILWNEPDMDVE